MQATDSEQHEEQTANGGRPDEKPSGGGLSDGKLYVLAWLALLALTLLSFGAHYLELGPFATAVSLAFAAVKASIVFGVFMHITREANSVRVVAGLNIACVILISVGLAVDILGH